MRRRTVWVFWSAVAVAALLLGSAVSSARSALSHPDASSLVPLALSMIGTAAALFVSARVVSVIAGAELHSGLTVDPHRARRGRTGTAR